MYNIIKSVTKFSQEGLSHALSSCTHPFRPLAASSQWIGNYPLTVLSSRLGLLQTTVTLPPGGPPKVQIMLFSCFKTICGVKFKLANLSFKGLHSLVLIYLSGLFPLAPSPPNMLLPVFNSVHYTCKDECKTR